mgnify:CR=1 FL=1
MTIGQIWVFNKRKKMKKTLIILVLSLFTSSAFAGSCPMLAGKVDTKIKAAQKLHDEGMAAHSSGDHAKSEKLLKQALELFKG